MRTDPRTSLYRTASLLMAIVFAAVGLLFLFLSGEVLEFFNRVSVSIGIPAGPGQAAGFYLGLAVSYMYLVALIALLMWRNPQERILPLLLANGKAASAILSAALFVFDRPLLIYGTNSLVDGAIAIGVFILYRKTLGRQK